MSRQNSRVLETGGYRRSCSHKSQESDKAGSATASSRAGCKASVCSAVDLKELMAEDPLMKRSLEMREMRSTRQNKISITSISTDVTDIFCSESDNLGSVNGWGGERMTECGGVVPVRRQR